MHPLTAQTLRDAAIIFAAGLLVGLVAGRLVKRKKRSEPGWYETGWIDTAADWQYPIYRKAL